MIKGMYSAYSALHAAWEYQEAIANNIANADTVGFKRELALLGSFDNVLLSERTPTPSPLNSRIQQVVGQIGTGTFVAEIVSDFTNGSITPTQRDLDLALDAGFFVVEDEAGEQFYTRDGRFSRDVNGNLVTSHGLSVLDVDGQPIALPGGSLNIDVDGQIVGEDGTAVATIGIVDFEPGQLERAGQAYFQSTEAGTPITGVLTQGALEASNADLLEEMTTLMAAYRTFQANQTIMARLDETLQTATQTIGEV